MRKHKQSFGGRFEPEKDPIKSVLHEDEGVPTPGLSPLS